MSQELKELGVVTIWDGVQLFYTWLVTHSIGINPQLTGKDQLILNSILNYVIVRDFGGGIARLLKKTLDRNNIQYISVPLYCQG